MFPDKVETTYNFEFVDAKSGDPIGLEDGVGVNVQFTGKDQGTVTSYEGISGSSYTSENGLLVVSSTKTATSADPFEVNAVAHLDGYVSSSLRVQAFETAENYFVIKMVKIDNTPTGVAAVQNTDISTSSGVTAAEVVIEAAVTSGSTSTATKTTVTVPAGIEMKDASGNVLKGAVKSTLVYFNNEDNESTTSFPGGFGARVDNNGSDEEGFFVTAGFVSLEMEVGGSKVSTFSTPITITTEVPASTINPKTDQPIQAGESIDIWSYDTETGQWKYENTATFGAQLSNGNFPAVMTPTHLSYWNLDWWGQNCSGAVITINAPDLTEEKIVSFEISNNITKTFFKRTRKRVKNGSTITLRRVPNTDLKIKAVDFGCGDGYVGELVFDGCGGGGTLNITKTASVSNAITVTADVSGYCEKDPNTLLKPSGTLYLRHVDASGSCQSRRYRKITLNRGKITIDNVIPGGTYRGIFRYNGKWHTRTMKADAATLNYILSGKIEDAICD